nr:immunoglobulin heavy chain junction region [Macaca mulatta]
CARGPLPSEDENGYYSSGLDSW